MLYLCLFFIFVFHVCFLCLSFLFILYVCLISLFYISLSLFRSLLYISFKYLFFISLLNISFLYLHLCLFLCFFINMNGHYVDITCRSVRKRNQQHISARWQSHIWRKPPWLFKFYNNRCIHILQLYLILFIQ